MIQDKLLADPRKDRRQPICAHSRPRTRRKGVIIPWSLFSKYCKSCDCRCFSSDGLRGLE